VLRHPVFPTFFFNYSSRIERSIYLAEQKNHNFNIFFNYSSRIERSIYLAEQKNHNFNIFFSNLQSQSAQQVSWWLEKPLFFR